MPPIPLMTLVHDLVLNAFDALAERIPAAEDVKKATGLQHLAESWKKLTQEERDELGRHITSAGALVGAAVPIAVATAKSALRRGAAADKPKQKKKNKTADDKKAGKKKDKKKKKNGKKR